MSVPQSVVKIKKDGVEYVSNCDRVQYTIQELTRAALRDVGKYVCKNFKNSYYGIFKKRSGRVGRFTQYWVKWKKQAVPSLEVGVKPNAFYGGYQEFGTNHGQPRLGLLAASVEDHIDEIIKIESQYLSALEDEAQALALISEQDYEGNADD